MFGKLLGALFPSALPVTAGETPPRPRKPDLRRPNSVEWDPDEEAAIIDEVLGLTPKSGE